jgi:hypothetical protein
MIILAMPVGICQMMHAQPRQKGSNQCLSCKLLSRVRNEVLKLLERTTWKEIQGSAKKSQLAPEDAVTILHTFSTLALPACPVPLRNLLSNKCMALAFPI